MHPAKKINFGELWYSGFLLNFVVLVTFNRCHWSRVEASFLLCRMHVQVRERSFVELSYEDGARAKESCNASSLTKTLC